MNQSRKDQEFFKEIIAKRARLLLSLANWIVENKSNNKFITRPVFGEMLSQSTQVEELIDAYGAGLNCQWCGFRSRVAAIKGFSDISYELLHVRNVLPSYHLLSIGQNFIEATDQTLDFTSNIIIKASQELLNKSKQLEIPFVLDKINDDVYEEILPSKRVNGTCEVLRTEVVSETVIMLSTAFLNLAAESNNVCAASRAKPEEYESYLAGSISEEKLRSLQLRFHNLQSQYDTYVSGTEVAFLDRDLPTLRGHISIIMHLLRIATLFTHHYERHITRRPCNSPTRLKPLVEKEQLINTLMSYCINNIRLYIESAVQLCQEKLQQYAKIDIVELSIPQYRGFHVRPSTLIAKLVQHYGGKVSMQIDKEIYNAGLWMELFRANEKINAQKRRWLTEEIVRLKLVSEEVQSDDIEATVLGIVLTLAGWSKLIMYEQPLQMPEEPARKEGTILEKVVDEMTRLLAMGKIDVSIDMTAKFRGDKRVLNDIKLLADSGYGEDKFGNNIPLPEKLSYLRR